MEFAHLHNHNEFSYLDGFGSAQAYAKRAKELGYKYLGLTNHGNIDGLIRFQSACEKEGIIPIHGCESYLVPDELVKEKGEKRNHITLLIKNQTGWQNLCKMLSKANIEGFYYKPRIGYKTLLEHSEGLICLTGCANNFLLTPNGENFFRKLINAFEEDLFLEVMPHNLQDQIELNNLCLKLSEKYNIPTVATNDCHYILKDQAKIQEVLLAIQSKAKWNDSNRWKFNIQGLHLRSIEEIQEAFICQGVLSDEEINDSLNCTIDICETCKDFRIEKQNINLPVVPGFEGNPGEITWEIAENKLLEISQDWDTNKINFYFERLREEWKLIEEKKFHRYFLIVHELILWCKENNIMTGPGRGSVGGSLLAYLLSITCVDPIQYNLLFSRFIAEDRIDLPDIDQDFEDQKRHLVREHLEALYGKENISSLSTFLSLKGRGIIRDVCRVFDIPLSEVDEFAKSIDDSEIDENDKILPEAFKTETGKYFYNKYPEQCDIAIALEGTKKTVGQHAAALIISNEDLRNGNKGNLAIRSGELVSNWDMQDSEYIGLMKLDVLGLNTLSILNETKRLIQNNEEKIFVYHPGSDCYCIVEKDAFTNPIDDLDMIDLDFEKIPLNDQKVFDYIREGNTVGMFQLSTWSMKNLIKQFNSLKNIEELSDIVALVRPGPYQSGMTAQYIDRKNNKTQWEKLHKKYENIVKDTFGIIIYQEQIMEVINKVAGLPYATADKIRKVISKIRGAKGFKPYEESFVKGCLEQKTFNEKQAREFWAVLQEHARYSFNKSHSVEYAILSYWTAWCKFYFPYEFICSCLTYGSEAKKEEIIEEAYRLGLTIVPPRIGISDPVKWQIKDQKLYVPFIEIKGIGEKTAYKCGDISKPQTQEPKSNKKTAPKLSGFFKPKNVDEENIVPANKKGKTEKILFEIGAYGNKPSGDIQSYFSFRIGNGVTNNNQKLIALVKNKDEEGILELKVKPVTKEPIIQENSFVAKKGLTRCHDCELREQCDKPVPASAGIFNIAIVGDAPGKKDNDKGVGFVGRSGDLVWTELGRYDLVRDNFHITNCCHCFPYKTKTPTQKEIETCTEKWLFSELQEIGCRLILAFGNSCITAFTGKKGGIASLNGKTEWNEKVGAWICWCIHPSSVLRDPAKMPEFKKGIANFVSKIELIEGE